MVLWAKKETVERLFSEACRMPVVDAHTHIQDDLTDFTSAEASTSLAGTQSAVNAYPDYIIQAGIANGRLARRTMMDVTHGCFYSWFAQIAEGHRQRLDDIIKTLGVNSEQERYAAGKMLLEELHDSRYSEYAEWLRFMFRLYDGNFDGDLLNPANYEHLWNAIQSQRNDPGFADKVLRDNQIVAYVTSIENRDKLSAGPEETCDKDLDLAQTSHPNAFSMFDAHYLLWPEGATDFGFYLGGHKYEAEKYLLHLERFIDRPLTDAATLRNGIKERLLQILYSPSYSPTSRVRYTNIFQPMSHRLGRPFDLAAVNYAIRYRKNCVRYEDLQQLTALATSAMLEALEEIGIDLKRNGETYGSCLQTAIGVSYFMDTSREIQSFPMYAPEIPQEEYAVWCQYPNIHFEYIVAHEQLYSDFTGAAKQVGNIFVGPWWHFFRKHKIAAMLVDQLSMGSINSIASGFTDARFVEMLAAKYRSVRWAVAMALAELVDDPASKMTYGDSLTVMRSLLFDNPISVHHIPTDQLSADGTS